MKRVLISAEPISAEVALAGLSDLGGGAVSSFTGISRDDGGVTAIELELDLPLEQPCTRALSYPCKNKSESLVQKLG